MHILLDESLPHDLAPLIQGHHQGWPKLKSTPWDPAEHLESEADMAAYLGAALEEGDPALVAAALDDIARANAMTQPAQETDLGRESLCRARSS